MISLETTVLSHRSYLPLCSSSTLIQGKIICSADLHDSSYPRTLVVRSLCNVTTAFTTKGWSLFL